MLYMEPWRLIHFVTGGLYPLTNISFPLPRLPVFFPQSMIDLYILQTSSMINIANLFPQISPLSFALACEDFFHVKTFFFFLLCLDIESWIGTFSLLTGFKGFHSCYLLILIRVIFIHLGPWSILNVFWYMLWNMNPILPLFKWLFFLNFLSQKLFNRKDGVLKWSSLLIWNTIYIIYYISISFGSSFILYFVPLVCLFM